MFDTPATLLERVRRTTDQRAWEQFVELYTPLMYAWARRLGLQPHDAGDLVQEVFVVLVRKLPEFSYEPGRTFRGWLRTVVINKWRDRCRQANGATVDHARLPDEEQPDAAALFEEHDYRRYLTARALEIIRAEFQPTTWMAFWESVVQGRETAAVAAELGMTPNAVYLARSRVLRRLRQRLDGLLDGNL